MQRDVAVIPINSKDEIVIACDNSGAIGSKPMDEVSAPYEMVSYFSFRVAWMECTSAGATPFSVIIQNFCGDEAWASLVLGIKRGIKEIGISQLPITGSTETNFTLIQSAVSMTILGKRTKRVEKPFFFTEQLKVAVIGSPLVGSGVIDQEDKIAPLKLFQWFCEQDEVMHVMPVGSKGVLVELEQIFAGQSLQFESDIDLQKSSGPSTCFIAIYPRDENERIEWKAAEWYHQVRTKIL